MTSIDERIAVLDGRMQEHDAATQLRRDGGELRQLGRGLREDIKGPRGECGRMTGSAATKRAWISGDCATR